MHICMNYCIRMCGRFWIKYYTVANQYLFRIFELWLIKIEHIWSFRSQVVQFCCDHFWSMKSFSLLHTSLSFAYSITIIWKSEYKWHSFQLFCHTNTLYWELTILFQHLLGTKQPGNALNLDMCVYSLWNVSLAIKFCPFNFTFRFSLNLQCGICIGHLIYTCFVCRFKWTKKKQTIQTNWAHQCAC